MPITTIKAVISIPMRLDKSMPADLKALPTSVLSKALSRPVRSINLFTALPTTEPIAHATIIINIAITP